jgi:hypothetical protein
MINFSIIKSVPHLYEYTLSQYSATARCTYAIVKALTLWQHRDLTQPLDFALVQRQSPRPFCTGSSFHSKHPIDPAFQSGSDYQ